MSHSLSVFNADQEKLLFEGKQELPHRSKTFLGDNLLYLDKFRISSVYLQRLNTFSCLFISIIGVSLKKVKRAQVLFKSVNLRFFSKIAVD